MARPRLSDVQRHAVSPLSPQGLWKCSNTKIGTNLIRGVSGGERKRCSIGMELVVDPAVLCTSCPTRIPYYMPPFVALPCVHCPASL